MVSLSHMVIGRLFLDVFTSTVCPVWVIWYFCVIFLIGLNVTVMCVHRLYECFDHDVDRLFFRVILIVCDFMVTVEGRGEPLNSFKGQGPFDTVRCF